jgi:lysozyme
MLTPPKQMSPEGAERLKENESCVLLAYQDPPGQKEAISAQIAEQGITDPGQIKAMYAKVNWAIGWGHNGPDVYEGLIWTQAQADAALSLKIEEIEATVNRCVTRQDCKQWQFDTFCDFEYNTGALCRSTMLKDFNEGDSDDIVEAELMKWIWTRGKISTGLQGRRRTEIAEFEGQYNLRKQPPAAPAGNGEA